MSKTTSWVVLFLFSLGLRAELVSLGEHGSLDLGVPNGWEISSQPSHNAALDEIQVIHLTPKNGANSLCFITVVFAAYTKPIDKAAIEREFRAYCEKFIATSVEKKSNVKELPLSPAYGLCATFTDVKLVGKPPQPDNFKVMTLATIQYTDSVSASVTVMTDDAQGPDQQELIRMVLGMKLAHREAVQVP